ncbi:hypothetical protein FKP32DRAFT_642076 [Trametes sanguinea]|nr:hypothetical protein FKP32DRAFT_642076 [Trametes sanguinea]
MSDWDGRPPPTIASQLNDFYATSSLVERHIRPLTLEWYLLGEVFTNVVFQAVGLCILTALTAVTVYIVISRKWKDAATFFLLSFVIPDWISLVIRWIRTISQTVQIWAILDRDMVIVRGGMDAITSCMLSQNCPEHPAWHGSAPGYLMHECVGTALFAVDTLMHQAIMCATVWWLSRRQEEKSSRMTSLILLAPVVAACVSATLHIQATCSAAKAPPRIDARIRRAWAATSEPLRLDATTAELTRFTGLVLSVFYARVMWRDRQGWIVSLTSGLPGLIWGLFKVFGVPACIYLAWTTLYKWLEGGRSISPLAYIIMSAMQSLVIPGTRVYPGFAILALKLKESRSSDDRNATATDGERVSAASQDPETANGNEAKLPEKSSEIPM